MEIYIEMGKKYLSLRSESSITMLKIKCWSKIIYNKHRNVNEYVHNRFNIGIKFVCE